LIPLNPLRVIGGSTVSGFAAYSRANPLRMAMTGTLSGFAT
jgi:hypothetical protein